MGDYAPEFPQHYRIPGQGMLASTTSGSDTVSTQM
jgi:hypothetical protein